MAITVLTKNNYEEEVLRANCPVLLDFWAEWCGPCKLLSPFVEQLSQEMPNVKFCKVNVDDEPSLAASFAITAIPTILLIDHCTVLDKSVGYCEEDALKRMIEAIL